MPPPSARRCRRHRWQWLCCPPTRPTQIITGTAFGGRDTETETDTQRERERERERESCGPPPLLLPSYSLSFSFYRVPNYVWMKRPRAKISRRRFFAVSNWLVSAMASSMRAREGKEGRKEERNEAPVEPNLTKNITINVE